MSTLKTDDPGFVTIILTNDENHPGQLGVENARRNAELLRRVSDEDLGELIADPKLHPLDLEVAKREAMRRMSLRMVGCV